MPSNYSLQLQSVLLARPSTLFTQGNAAAAAAATTCALVRQIQQSPASTSIRLLSNSSYQSRSLSPQPKLQIRSSSSSSSKKPLTQRYTSTISSNPPPPSTADRARRPQQTYTPPPPPESSSSRPATEAQTQTQTQAEAEVEAVPIPDPTTSYAAPMSSTSPSSTSPPTIPLTWNAFLALRKTRRRYNLLASVSTSLLTTSTGISVLAQQNIETAGVFGLDPFLVLGLATAGSGAVGWLMGPFVGNAVFAMVHRSRRGEMAEKERDLYRRIKQHRVDPSSSSAGNPVPDYYGEKIGSVAEYRTWMKDQRAYNKRRQNFL